MSVEISAIDAYNEAKKRGRREYNKLKAHGGSGHLTSLDGILKDTDIVNTIYLGQKEISLSRIVGTYYHSRRTMFSKSFLPLEPENTEFGQKWNNLYRAHLEEGIRDPIKVYEFFNYYYVMEGNKRVSVLKFMDAVSITADITRLVPQYDSGDEDIVNYYAFLSFYKKTSISTLWLSKPRRFQRLEQYLEHYQPILKTSNTVYEHFLTYVYKPFREIYLAAGGQSLPMTTGDAFLLYAKLYGIPDYLDELHVAELMPNLLKELANYGDSEDLEIKTTAEAVEKVSLINAFTSWIAPKKLKVGFVYARDTETSGWTYAHDLGRLQLQEQFGDQITTESCSGVPEDDSAYEHIKNFAMNDYDVVFTTSEVFRRATLKCAMELPNVKFFNCSGNRPYVHMANYFGRTYEPRFLTGLLAGALTETGIVGYTATDPNPEVISGINAFALGMAMVNPRAKLMVMWTGEWNNPKVTTDLAKLFVAKGADVVCNKTISIQREVTKDYGIYAMLCKMDIQTGEPTQYLAAPIWRWGTFYTKIVASIFNGTYQRMVHSASEGEKPHHFWWGMGAGVVDVYMATEQIPRETLRLVELLKNSIIDGQFHPFTGPIWDQEGVLRVPEGSVLDPEAILSMDWLKYGIEVLDH